MTKHLLLPGVDTVEEITLQIHQDVVTYQTRDTASHTYRPAWQSAASFVICATVCLCSECRRGRVHVWQSERTHSGDFHKDAICVYVCVCNDL